jgi:hypothetical protein
MTTSIELQRDLIERYDRAIAGLRELIVKRGGTPLPVAVITTPGDGIEGALRRRKTINAVLCRQFTDLMKGTPR